MLEEIINYIGGTALKHKAVKSYQYKKRSLINTQNNEAYIQFIIEESGGYIQKVITRNVYTLTLNIDILAFPEKEEDTLRLQSDCLQVGAEVIAYINQDNTYRSLISVYDYDFLTISKYTDDNACGQRLTLELVIPEPVSLCTLLDNFDEDTDIVEQQNLDLTKADNVTPAEEKKTITLKPMKLR